MADETKLSRGKKFLTSVFRESKHPEFGGYLIVDGSVVVTDGYRLHAIRNGTECVPSDAQNMGEDGIKRVQKGIDSVDKGRVIGSMRIDPVFLEDAIKGFAGRKFSDFVRLTIVEVTTQDKKRKGNALIIEGTLGGRETVSQACVIIMGSYTED